MARKRKKYRQVIKHDLIYDAFGIFCPSEALHNWYCEFLTEEVRAHGCGRERKLLPRDLCAGIFMLYYRNNVGLVSCARYLGESEVVISRTITTLLRAIKFTSRHHWRKALFDKLPKQYLAIKGKEYAAYKIPFGEYVRVDAGKLPQNSFILPTEEALPGERSYRIISQEEAVKTNPPQTGTYRSTGYFLIEVHTNYDARK